MGLYEDAREGDLDADALNEYVRKDPNLLNKPDPKEGLTPLAAASIKGHVEVVELLLKKCARADATSQNGETPLLLATDKCTTNRPRIVQLLLQKTPPCFVDATCLEAKRNTPLMFAIKQRDLESITLLRKAGARLMLRNSDHFSAKDLAKQTGDNAVERALYLDKEHSDLLKLAKLVLDLLVFTITWVNQVTGSICRMFKLDREMNQVTEELLTGLNCELNTCPNQINNKSPCDPPDHDFEDLSKVHDFSKDTRLKYFYKGRKEYLNQVARKAVDLKKDESTSLGSEDLLHKTIKVSLHRQVIYCDDSSSMRTLLNGEPQKTLWDCQKELVEHITQLTTRILPEGEGVVLRFINKDVTNSLNLTTTEIREKLAGMEPVPANDSHTRIGTFLKSRILEPLVYDKLKEGGLKRPLLISVITDGRPTVENHTDFVNVILECGRNLENSGYSREDVKFVIGQIGAASAAATFLDTLRNNAEITKVVYCTTDRLDERFAEFRENKKNLDRWLIETLYKPIEASYEPIKVPGQ